MMKTKASTFSLSLIVGAAFFMEQLDSTIIAPAVPEIAKSLHVGPLSLDLAMTVYLLCSVVFIPVSGILAGRYGTRSIFRASLLLFVGSSALCGFADSLWLLVAARAVQGFSGALMVPVGRIAIVRTTPRAVLVDALAWMITPAMLGPLLGPPLGGVIATVASWRWIFWLNVPIGLAGYGFAKRLMPQVVDADETRVAAQEWLGLSVALTALIALLELVRRHSLPASLIGAIVVVLVVATWLYARAARRSVVPLLDFGLLRIETFRVSFIAGSLIRVGYGALPFLLPLMLQVGLGFSAIGSGAVMLVSGAVALVTKTQTTGLLRRFGFRSVLIVNGTLCAIALIVCAAFGSGWGIGAIACVVAAGGIARSVQFNALGAIAYADVPSNKVSPATTLNTAAQQLAVMIGISLAVTVVDFSSRLASRARPEAVDFAYAFTMVGLVALLAVPFCWFLSTEAGHELSGRPARSR